MFASSTCLSGVRVLAAVVLIVAPTLAAANASCPAGSYSPTGQSPCTLCAPGFFQPNAGQTSCRAAQIGWRASGPGAGGSGATSEAICEEGTYSANSGSAACTSCPAGSYCNGQGATEPTPCPPGYFSATPGAGQMCTACPKGSFQAGRGSTSCCTCCSGFYNDQTSQTHCFNCPVKDAFSPAGATSATQCSSKLKGGLDTCVQSANDKCPNTGSSPTQAPHRQRAIKRSSCAAGHKSCPVYGSALTGRRAGFLKGYECVDVQNDLESCGGCVLPDDSPFGERTADGGRDCSAIPFVSDVTCREGSCVVRKCRDGYAPAPDSGSCVALLEDMGSVLHEQF